MNIKIAYDIECNEINSETENTIKSEGFISIVVLKYNTSYHETTEACEDSANNIQFEAGLLTQVT